jgi:excisionase family DNA binding protein
VADAVCLDQLAAEPTLVRTLSRDALVDLARRVAVLEAAVRVELAIAGHPGPPPLVATSPDVGIRYLSPTDVAERLGVTVAHVREQCRTGQLPALRAGKYWRIPVDPLTAHLAARTTSVDRDGSDTLHSSHAPLRGPRDPRPAGPFTIRVRRLGGRAPGDGSEVGSGDAARGGTGRPAPAPAGRSPAGPTRRPPPPR